MWIGILAALDKILGILGQCLGWWIKRSDESKKKQDAAQVEMQEAVKKGDLNAYWNARSRRNRA